MGLTRFLSFTRKSNHSRSTSADFATLPVHPPNKSTSTSQIIPSIPSPLRNSQTDLSDQQNFNITMHPAPRRFSRSFSLRSFQPHGLGHSAKVKMLRKSTEESISEEIDDLEQHSAILVQENQLLMQVNAANRIRLDDITHSRNSAIYRLECVKRAVSETEARVQASLSLGATTFPSSKLESPPHVTFFDQVARAPLRPTGGQNVHGHLRPRREALSGKQVLHSSSDVLLLANTSGHTQDENLTFARSFPIHAGRPAFGRPNRN